MSDLRGSFREAMACLTGGVCVITTVDDDGTPAGLTVTTGFSVSMEPPLFGVCVDVTSRTLRTLVARSAFVANVLTGDSEHVAATFARPARDKFARTGYGLTPSGLPWLPRHSLRGVECSVTRTYEAGDHLIVLGHVDAVHRPDTEGAHGLGYLGRAFHAIPR